MAGGSSYSGIKRPPRSNPMYSRTAFGTIVLLLTTSPRDRNLCIDNFYIIRLLTTLILPIDNFSVIGFLTFPHFLSPSDNYQNRRVDHRDDDRRRDGEIPQPPSETPWCNCVILRCMLAMTCSPRDTRKKKTHLQNQT